MVLQSAIERTTNELWEAVGMWGALCYMSTHRVLGMLLKLLSCQAARQQCSVSVMVVWSGVACVHQGEWGLWEGCTAEILTEALV